MKCFWIFSLVLALSASKAFSGEHEWDNDSDSSTRPAAPVNPNNRIVGCIFKDNEGEALTFNVKVGNDDTSYRITGSTMPDQGIYQSNSNYNGVSVVKNSLNDGLTYREQIPNHGTVLIFPRRRSISNAELAGVAISGSAVTKLFTGSIDMSGLNVANQPSSGKLFYNVFNGRYSCHAGNCSFGTDAIGSNDPTRAILNYDNFINRNRMRVSMTFGPLSLKGMIKFTDTTRTDVDTDSNGNTNSTTVVTSTRGCFNVDLRKNDGAPLRLSGANQSPSQDDQAVRRLMAWLELFSFDVFSE